MIHFKLRKSAENRIIKYALIFSPKPQIEHPNISIQIQYSDSFCIFKNSATIIMETKIYNRRVNSRNDSQLSCIKNQKMFWDPRDPSTFTYKLTFQCFQGLEQVTSDEFSVDGTRFYLEIYSSGKSFYFYWNCSLFCPIFPEEDCYPTVCLHLADETITAIQVRAKAMYILHLLINNLKLNPSEDEHTIL